MNPFFNYQSLFANKTKGTNILQWFYYMLRKTTSHTACSLYNSKLEPNRVNVMDLRHMHHTMNVQCHGPMTAVNVLKPDDIVVIIAFRNIFDIMRFSTCFSFLTFCHFYIFNYLKVGWYKAYNFCLHLKNEIIIYGNRLYYKYKYWKIVLNFLFDKRIFLHWTYC